MPMLLIASGFFSGTETALFSLSQHQRLTLSRSKTMAGVTISALLAETRDILITILLGNMVVNVLYFTIAAVLLMGFKRSREVNPLVITALGIVPLVAMILFGEVLPKLVAVRMSLGWSKVAALPMMVVHRGLGPVRVISNRLIITPLARLIAPRSGPTELTAEELQSLLETSEQRGVIDAGEERMLQQVLTLGQLKVKDIMKPRVDIHAFNLDDQPDELLKLIERTRQNHIPVYRGDLDHIEGLIHSKQFLLNRPGNREGLQPLVRQITFVPDLQRADQLLIDFRKRGVTFAIAVDEYGGTAGLVTLEDVVEQMVGDIAGPDDKPKKPEVLAVGLGLWQVSANLAIHQWADAFGPLRTPQAVSTIGGLVMSRLGKLPKTGDKTRIGNVDIEVQTMQGRRIETLLIRLRKPVDVDAEEAAQR